MSSRPGCTRSRLLSRGAAGSRASEQGGVRSEQLWTERPEAGETFERALTTGDEGAFDSDDVFVEVGLEGHSRVPGHLRDRHECFVGGDLGNGHREGGVDEGLSVPPAQVAFGGSDHLGDSRGAHSPTQVIADDAEHAAQSDVGGDVGDRGDIDAGSGAGVGDGGEAAAQGFPSGQSGGDVDGFGVHVRLHRHPDALEDLGGFAEDEGLAEGLSQVVVGVDEPGHEQASGQIDADRFGDCSVALGIRTGGVRIVQQRCGRGGHLGEGTDGEDPTVVDEHRMAGLRAFGQEHFLRNEEGRGLVEAAQLSHGVLRTSRAGPNRFGYVQSTVVGRSGSTIFRGGSPSRMRE